MSSYRHIYRYTYSVCLRCVVTGVARCVVIGVDIHLGIGFGSSYCYKWC